MNDAERQQGSEPWKQKYYDALQQLETKERRWADVESLLRRTIARMSLAADGRDPVLDTQLETLREVVRNGDDARLNTALESFSKTLMRLDKQSARESGAAPHAALGRLLERIELAGDANRKVKALRDRLAAVKDEAGVNALVDEFAALLKAAHGPSRAAPSAQDTAAAAPHAEPEGRGLFGGLFSRRADKSPLVQLLDGLAAPQHLEEPFALLRKRAAAAGNQAEQQRLVDELAKVLNGVINRPGTASGGATQPRTSDMLLQLLDNLALPSEMSDQVAAVRAKIDAGVEPGWWEEVLQDVARLVSHMRAGIEREKDELEAFLEQLTDRLRDLEQHLAGAESAREASIASGRELNTAVQDHVRSIETSVREAADFDQLKHTIQARLDAIRANMEVHRRAEEDRSAELEHKLKELNDRLQMMEREAEQLRTRVKEERLQALVDALTGISNRLAYDERIALEYARWKRAQSPLTLIVWDVDRFKSINDTYGHKAGDKVLKSIAQLLAAQVRETDFVARYGGEEFVMLLTNTSAQVALSVAEKLRGAVETCGFHYSGQAVPITISCGIADFRDGDTPERVFERADAALYRAKQDGRNACRLHDAA